MSYFVMEIAEDSEISRSCEHCDKLKPVLMYIGSEYESSPGLVCYDCLLEGVRLFEQAIKQREQAEEPSPQSAPE